MKARTKTQKIAFMGLMFALAMVLSLLEGMMPPVAALPPGVKLGLSNIVSMYCIFSVGKQYAFLLTVLKAIFVFLTRGFTAAVLSLSGGILSVAVMCFILWITRDKCSYLFVSVLGAISHNFGQIVVASLILETKLYIYYFPILLISGLVCGTITSCIIRVVMPHINKIMEK